jgi:hypothetical protein
LVLPSTPVSTAPQSQIGIVGRELGFDDGNVDGCVLGSELKAVLGTTDGIELALGILLGDGLLLGCPLGIIVGKNRPGNESSGSPHTKT